MLALTIIVAAFTLIVSLQSRAARLCRYAACLHPSPQKRASLRLPLNRRLQWRHRCLACRCACRRQRVRGLAPKPLRPIHCSLCYGYCVKLTIFLWRPPVYKNCAPNIFLPPAGFFCFILLFSVSYAHTRSDASRFTCCADGHNGSRFAAVMSAITPKADMCSATAHVCFGPKADSCSAAKRIAIRSPRRRGRAVRTEQ